MKTFVLTLSPPKILPLTCLVLSLSACKAGWDNSGSSSSSSSSSSAASNITTFHGPNARWTLDLDSDSNTFSLDQLGGTNNWTNDGSYQALTSGFLQLTKPLTGSLNNVIVPAIQISDELTVLQGLPNTGDELVVLASKNPCAGQSLSTNWLMYKSAANFNGDTHSANHFGTFTHSVVGSGQTNLETQFNLSDPTPEQPIAGIPLSTGICDNSLLTNENIQQYFSGGNSTVTEIATNTDERTNGNPFNSQYIVGLEQRTITARANFDGDYIGLLRDQNLPVDFKVMPLQGSCTAGTCVLTEITHLENGTLASSDYTLDLSSEENSPVDRPSAGFIVGTLNSPTPNSESGTISCSVNIDYSGSGEKVIACIGVSPGTTETNSLVNLFLVAKP